MTLGQPRSQQPEDRPLPSNVRELYTRLANEVAEMNRRWNMYRDLFLGSEARIALLQSSAGVFFGTLQRMLLDDVVLGITRLSDPARTGRFTNQSLLALAEEFADQSYPELAQELRSKLARVESACAPFRNHRDKRIAHRDLTWSLTPHIITLPDLAPADFDRALKGLNAILNTVEDFFTDLTFTGYSYVIEPLLSSTDGLLWALKKAAALDVAEPNQMKHGQLMSKTKYGDA